MSAWALLLAALLTCIPSFAQSGMGPQKEDPQFGRKQSGSSHSSTERPSTADRGKQQLPELVDITASTGITFQHQSSPEQKYIVESMSGGVALIDYDRDGWPDIYFTNAQSVQMALSGKKSRSALYHNNHDGTFTDVTEKAGVGYPCWAMGAVVGDYDNDGWPDLLVTCFGGVVLYRNQHDGTFKDVTRQAGLSNDTQWATGATFGDYDGDGWVDLFVSHYVDFHLDDLPAFGSSKTCKYEGIDVQCGPRGLKGAPDNLYHNNGDGTFTDVSKKARVDDPQKYFGLTSVWEDFDDDGRLDLFVTNDGETNYLYHNNGDGTFTDIAMTAGVALSDDGSEQANMGVALGDYLNTGRRFSIAVSHFNHEYAALFRNDGNNAFTDSSAHAGLARRTAPYVGWGDGFFDFDNDGWQDFFLVNGHVYPQVDNAHLDASYREPKLLFLNQRDGTFKDISQLAGPAIQTPQVSRGVAMGDLFNDGRIDIVVENLSGGPMILRPTGGPANHWISFELEGTKSNHLALNARVRATAGDLVQLGEVHSGGSYLSQSDLRIHFGLENRDHLDKVEILWPAGKTEVFENIAADHYYRVTEGKGITLLHPQQPESSRHP
ncbi:MAG TPA: CRTAC1 family protein [Acidisarcina sp.]|nr:CRTAC1 family protein [Acidisarcina sp.]